MSLKMEFVKKAMKPHARMSSLCLEYGISRETGYKWLGRYKREGFDGLEEKSRRPKSSPLGTAEDVVVAILKLREAYPRRGPKKLRVQLERTLGSVTPSTATIARVLKRMGLVRQRSKVSPCEHRREEPGRKAAGATTCGRLTSKAGGGRVMGSGASRSPFEMRSAALSCASKCCRARRSRRSAPSSSSYSSGTGCRRISRSTTETRSSTCRPVEG